MVWMNKRQSFPPLLILRRYIKLIACYCDDHDILDVNLDATMNMILPFELQLLPFRYPQLVQLQLLISPSED